MAESVLSAIANHHHQWTLYIYLLLANEDLEILHRVDALVDGLERIAFDFQLLQTDEILYFFRNISDLIVHHVQHNLRWRRDRQIDNGTNCQF